MKKYATLYVARKGLMDHTDKIFKYTEIVTDEILVWKEGRRGT